MRNPPETPVDDSAPFRFEDLNGDPEPARWGEPYPKAASSAVEKWRTISKGRALTSEEEAEYGSAVHAWTRSRNAPKKTENTLPTTSACTSGQPHDYDRKKYAAAMVARLSSDAAVDKRQWALGKTKGFARGEREMTIVDVYKRAMTEKRAKTTAARRDVEAAFAELLS